MPKEFYTEKDIEDLFGRGIKSLQITENVVLTELAYEKANRLGLQLISERADTPPAAPVRPYLSEAGMVRAQPAIAPVVPPALNQTKPTSPDTTDVEKRIRSAVIARLGNQVDPKLLDNIIHRVVKGVGLK
ncbi:MAG TPA: hypothetical protein VK249_26850 [Anaerolineales bacterium]|nr:hypothetical protein [Anaerolineales bacterium]